MRHAWLCFAVLASALALAPFAYARDNRAARAELARYERQVWYWQTLMRLPRTPRGGRPGKWRRLAVTLARRAQRPPHWSQWLCIHQFEGSWTANTGNGYYGGLQMDLDFQREYAPGLLRQKGTANRWSPVEQMWVAERAHRSGRGFTPWPNTARMCGLL
jgi:Transglycosylase-like domain